MGILADELTCRSASLRVEVRTDAQRKRVLDQEWLLTDGAGGYAMGTVSGLPSRRYHGLLVSALCPPTRRMLLLHSLGEIVTLDPGTREERQVDLTALRFADGTTLSGGADRLVSFELGEDAVWTFDFGGGIQLRRTVHLVRLGFSVEVRYALSGGTGRVVCRPLLAMRDHHALRPRPDETVRIAGVVGGAGVGGAVCVGGDGFEATIESISPGGFHLDPHWWRDVSYTTERDRGYDSVEALFSPGRFDLDLGEPAMLVARLGGHGGSGDAGQWPPGDSEGNRDRPARAVVRPALPERGRDEAEDSAVALLVRAADQFVVRRAPTPEAAADPGAGSSIIAGYPWFADWGRDSMIALPGLLIALGRLDEAASVLRTFAAARRDGLIPNRFDDEGCGPEFNTVDASLWFIQAVAALVSASDHPAAVMDEFVPVCLEIVSAYSSGTRFGIALDHADGLIRAGDAGTQLTWMDAQRDGVVFTPRFGKPVEIQALWHSGLRSLAMLLSRCNSGAARHLTQLAERCAESIRDRFWSEAMGCAYDRLEPVADGDRPIDELRPNQLFLVSLEHCPLEQDRARRLVRRCHERLWTPRGVRTLDPADHAYRGRFAGPIRDLDAAYHNGTAWPWLLGPMAEAWLRAHDFEPEACCRARAMIEPMLGLIRDPNASSLGQLYEVYDGDMENQHAGGCPAQAWSISEILRVLLMIRRAESMSVR